MFRLPLLDVAPAVSPASEAELDAPSRVRRFRARDYVGYSAKLASRMLQSRVLLRHRPLLVNIEPTHRCNLDCVYCDKVDPKSPQMETNAALSMIDQLAEIYAKNLVEVTNLIHSKIGKRAQQFADAFKWRKDT